jgi:Fe-S oxidoreductase
LSLKTVNDSVKHHLVEQREVIVTKDPRNELPALLGPRDRSPETLWACTSCGYCEAACPIELEHLDKFFRLRQHQVMIAGEFPHELKKVFEAYESRRATPGGCRSSSAATGPRAWTCRVAQRRPRPWPGYEFLFYVGSALSYDPRGQKIARAFVSPC